MQISDVLQKPLIRRGVEGLGPVVPMPRVDLALQEIALFQQLAGAGRKVMNDVGECHPKLICRKPGTRQSFIFNEVEKHCGDVKIARLYASRHRFNSFS